MGSITLDVSMAGLAEILRAFGWTMVALYEVREKRRRNRARQVALKAYAA